MPERSFGRTVRYRRTKMGLSQAKLGDLVGRSASTVRSWERDNSVPGDQSVLDALAAVLDIDTGMLYGKAGFEPPPEESSPTVEEALATLEPEPPADEDQERVESREQPPKANGDQTSGGDAEHPREPEREPKHVSVLEPAVTPPPGYVAPREPLVYTAASPRVVEPSYVEDANQRQIYRIRNLATVVLVVALAVVLVWALSNAWDSFSTWWDDFFGQLRL